MPGSKYANEKKVPVLYLDIDDTVRKGKDTLGHFVNEAKDVEVFEEVPNLLTTYKEHGWRIVGVSNQGGIALGHMSSTTCMAAMTETQKQCLGAFDKILWCPHHPDAADLELARCWCRKPKSGMLVAAATELAVQHSEMYPVHMSLMVGDRPEDKQVAENADLDFLDAAEWRKGQHLAGWLWDQA